MNKNGEIFFVAEISANHLQNFDRCIELIKLAKISGASAVKFQTYTPDTMTLDINSESFRISKNHELWGGKKLFDLYREAMTPWEWFPRLFDYANELDIIAFSSPFDASAVDFLEDLNCPIYKIASMEMQDRGLIDKVLKTGKPVIISTGASNWNEVLEMVNKIENKDRNQVALLACTSSYPARLQDSHLNRIKMLKEAFDCTVGISDHTLSFEVPLVSVALGAQIIERHFIDDRRKGGPDASFSTEPDEFKRIVESCKIAIELLNSNQWEVLPAEKESRKISRSLILIKDVKKGEKITMENVKALRPNIGLSPSQFSNVLGKKFNKDLHRGAGLKMDFIDE